MKHVFKIGAVMLLFAAALTGYAQKAGTLGRAISNTGRGVIVGKDGAAYKMGIKPIEVIYQSSGLQSDFSFARKGTSNVTVNGTTSMNGMVGVAVSDPMKNSASLVQSGEIPGKNSMSYLAGEPVPGAEIFVELESGDNQKIMPFTSANPFRKVLDLQSNPSAGNGRIKVKVKLNESCFPYFMKDGKRMVSSGIYIFGLESTINKVKGYSEFAVVINEPVTSVNIDGSGPFSQSLSNIEDGKLINPSNQKGMEIEVKLFLINSFTDVILP